MYGFQHRVKKKIIDEPQPTVCLHIRIYGMYSVCYKCKLLKHESEIEIIFLIFVLNFFSFVTGKCTCNQTTGKEQSLKRRQYASYDDIPFALLSTLGAM